MENLKRLINIVLENRNRKPIEHLHSSMELRNDLGFDSLDLAELTVRIESEYSIDIFDDGIVSTVGEIWSKIQR